MGDNFAHFRLFSSFPENKGLTALETGKNSFSKVHRIHRKCRKLRQIITLPMQAFVVLRSSLFDERQWRMFSVIGFLIAAIFALVGLTDGGVLRLICFVSAGMLIGLIGLAWVYQARGKVERLVIEGAQLTRTRRLLIGTRQSRQTLSSLQAFEFRAYDGRALESRLDAWFRRAHQHPDPNEYLGLISDAGGKVYSQRQAFKRSEVDTQPVWELRMVFADGEVWQWRYRNVPAKERKALGDFLVFLSRR
jgi:hypothetical protein